MKTAVNIALLALLLQLSQAFAQFVPGNYEKNLVPNGSFENHRKKAAISGKLYRGDRSQR